jgi:hypothetical protein
VFAPLEASAGAGCSCRPKTAEGNEDFLFEFEAVARGKEAGNGGGGLHLTADSTHGLAAAPPAAGGEESGLLAGVVRSESSGDGYAPDSKALLARAHRWAPLAVWSSDMASWSHNQRQHVSATCCCCLPKVDTSG